MVGKAAQGQHEATPVEGAYADRVDPRTASAGARVNRGGSRRECHLELRHEGRPFELGLRKLRQGKAR